MSKITDLVDTYQFTTHQLRWVHTGMRAVAEEKKHAPSLATLDAAEPYLREAEELRQRFDTEHAPQPDSRDALEADAEIDDLVRGIHETLLGQRRFGKERARLAARLLAEAFPKGVGHHVGAMHPVQASLNEQLVRTLGAKRHGKIVLLLGLDEIAQTLKDRNVHFRELLVPEKTITVDEVDGAVKRATEALLHAVFSIAVSFGPFGPNLELRDAILLPYVDMVERIRLLLKARRKGKKVKAAMAETTATPPGTGPTATASTAASPPDDAPEESPSEAEDAPVATDPATDGAQPQHDA